MLRLSDAYNWGFKGWGKGIYLETRIEITAAGRIGVIEQLREL